jgi:hypothetical protein
MMLTILTGAVATVGVIGTRATSPLPFSTRRCLQDESWTTRDTSSPGNTHHMLLQGPMVEGDKSSPGEDK